MPLYAPALRAVSLVLALSAALPAAGCTDDELGGHDLEAVTGSDGDLHLAIRTSALENRWFLSAFLAQYFPGDFNQGAVSSLGTRVVSFRRYNDRLVVLDVDDRTASGPVLDPELIADAFPIVEERTFRTPGGSDPYVVIDPAAGLTHFQVITTSADRQQLAKLKIELAFSQEFRRTSDGGAAWQTVFSGSAAVPINPPSSDEDPYPLDPDPFHASGTLGISLRPYSEGSHYRQVPIEPSGEDLDHEHYFQSPRRLVPGTVQLTQVAAHWDIYPGMTPIEWLISPELAALDETPAYADIDLVAAVQRGVESWNEAFGFPALVARLAQPGEDFWQDDKNYLVFDPVNDPTRAAMADMRVNPNTGEIRGASVYFGANWLQPFKDEAPEPEAMAPPTPTARLGWAGMPAQPLCMQRPPLRRLSPGALAGMTGKEKLERHLGQLIAHEIGHTLGLRHNFKGSLVPPSASAMDYLNPQEAIALGPSPASYDVAAIQYLYGLSSAPPAQPFCTDQRLGLDPLCQQHDASADPLHQFHPGNYAIAIKLLTALAEWLNPSFVELLLDGGLIEFIKSGSPADAAFAWQTAIDGLGAPLAPKDATPEHVAVSNLVMAWLLDAVADRHPTALKPAIIEQAVRIALDVDDVRPRSTRAAVIAALKKMQSHTAYMALLTVRGQLAAALQGGALSTEEALEVQDLIERIDRATSPYFD
jgi:Met-zincin